MRSQAPNIDRMVQESPRHCDNCESIRLFAFIAKCSDMFWGQDVRAQGGRDWPRRDAPCYVPECVLGGGDFVRGILCLKCGKWQGEFPATIAGQEQEGAS